MIYLYKKNKKIVKGFTPTPTLKRRRKWVSGFTLIEVLIACSIITVSMLALMETAQKGLTLSHVALRKSQASLLLEEGAEAVKSIRDNSWTAIADLNLDVPYYLFFNTNTKMWELNDSSTTNTSQYIPTYPLDGVFERKVVFSAVGRDSNDNILASGGTIDTGIKKVTVIVTWPPQGTTLESKSLSFYIADIFN